MQNTLAIGDSSKAIGTNSTALGSNALADDFKAQSRSVVPPRPISAAPRSDRRHTLMGTTVRPSGKRRQPRARESSAYGFASVAGATAASALGWNARANATNSTVLGFNRNVSATAISSVAIGEGAQATASKAVALGSQSVADVANTISVGSVGKERRIVNVAAGTLLRPAPMSSMAVNSIPPTRGSLPRSAPRSMPADRWLHRAT